MAAEQEESQEQEAQEALAPQVEVAVEEAQEVANHQEEVAGVVDYWAAEVVEAVPIHLAVD